ncbi:MAG: hypothetical protein IEMM0006_0196 [bacterium]|nr:MAG: hypothetical protein IEMM0006_0196 [bacterium]
MEQFASVRQDKADFFEIREISSVLSLKAETHNFPTTVEPLIKPVEGLKTALFPTQVSGGHDIFNIFSWHSYCNL